MAPVPALAQKLLGLYTERFPLDTQTRRQARGLPRRGGCMRRFVLSLFAILTIFINLGGLIGCGGGSPTTTSALPTPSKVSLSPANSRLALGSTLQLTAIPLNSLGNGIAGLPLVYTSSNPSVLTFVPAGGGVACAGKWD